MRISDWSSDVCSSDLSIVPLYAPVFKELSPNLQVLCVRKIRTKILPVIKGRGYVRVSLPAPGSDDKIGTHTLQAPSWESSIIKESEPWRQSKPYAPGPSVDSQLCQVRTDEALSSSTKRS